MSAPHCACLLSVVLLGLQTGPMSMLGHVQRLDQVVCQHFTWQTLLQQRHSAWPAADNISYTVALYGLYLFYLGTKDEIYGYSPVKKFIAVKSVVFATYWQSLMVPLIFTNDKEHSDQYNDFILCCEMVLFARLHYKARQHSARKRGR